MNSKSVSSNNTSNSELATAAGSERLRASGRAVIETEARAVTALAQRINENFVAACRLMLQCPGRVIVMGMGKSGHIAGKIAATLASTGTPAFFVHPAEAGHGDLGMITAADVVLALSNSGETDEILTLLPLIKRLGIPMISLTGKPGSTLGQQADVVIDVSVAQEACPLDLAPTSSTTATLAMGDALAIALLEAKGFTREDFALSHPHGSLGRRLLLRVADVMHRGDQVPSVPEGALVSEALYEITKKSLGMTAVVDEQRRVIGIFTDGDLRRSLDRGLDVKRTPVSSVMTRSCKTVCPQQLAAEGVQIMEKYKINALIVVDDANCLVGALNMHDLLRAGVV